MRWLLLLLVLPAQLQAATFVYLSSESSDELVAFGRRIRLSEADTPVDVFAGDGGGLSMALTDPAFSQRYFLYFVPPPGQHFAPGPYDGAAGCGFGDQPGVCVERELYGAPVEGHLEVREAAYDTEGHLVRFAVDFSQHAAGVIGRLTGSVRWKAGGGACDGAPDATPCDDLDACTSASACAGGHCVATATTDCGGPAAVPCHDAAVCDPAAGTCQPGTLWNEGLSCQPADACAYTSYCTAGACPSDSPTFCGDSDSCTYDTCDSQSGCAFLPIPGSCGHPGAPGVLAFLRGVLPDRRGDHLPAMVINEPGSTVDVRVGLDGTSSATVSGRPGYWSFTFTPPAGTTLGPGTYENVAPTSDPARPGLSVSTPYALDCSQPVGRFVVREISPRFVEGDRGQAAALSVDFEQRCPDGQLLAGAIRLRAGDPSCVGATDGAACDDLNACTARSTCQGGFCIGADPVVCPAPTDGCHATPLCDPVTGGCVGPALLNDGTTCEDPGTCVTGSCDAGRCTSPDPTCDDANPCTADRCDGASGCLHDDDPTCWRIAARTVLTAQAVGTLQGHDVICGPTRCQRSGGGRLHLNGDGTYRSPSDTGGPLGCPADPSITVPDEVGVLRRARGGRLILRPSNFGDVKRALRACKGRKFSVNRYHAWIKLSDDGRELLGQTRLSLTVPAALPIQETVVAHLAGARRAEATTPAGGARLATCADQIRLQCRLR